MVALPTVRLRRRSDGRVRIVNALDYARNLGAWAGWVRVGETSPPTAAADILAAAAQADIIEQARHYRRRLDDLITT